MLACLSVCVSVLMAFEKFRCVLLEWKPPQCCFMSFCVSCTIMQPHWVVLCQVQHLRFSSLFQSIKSAVCLCWWVCVCVSGVSVLFLCLYCAVIRCVSRVNSDVFLASEVFQRWHFMHLRSPRHRATHLMLCLCLLILPAPSPTSSAWQWRSTTQFSVIIQ